MVRVPRNLEELRAVPDRVDRIQAASEYITNGLAKIAEARAIRDSDIVALADEHGPAEAARMAGVSLSTVKALRRGRS
jgi:hypothetical protein